MNYFDDALSKHFSFESFAEGLDDLTFAVINFTGYEAISKAYDFEIMLLSSNKEIDLEEILQAQAVFTIHRGGNDNVLYNGIISEFDQLHEVNDVIFYRARLVPKMWWLNLTHHNQVFLNQSVPEIVEDALRDGGMESTDFDVSGLSGYEELSYSCQYDESHFNYFSRILERQGIYYYFTQESDGEVLVMTDTKFSHEALKEGAELFYNPASGLEGHHLGEAIGSFTCRQKQLPAEIILKDYNYEKPSLDITSRADVDEAGRGVSYLYGEYFATPEEGERFAGIRAEELLCQKQEFFGESTVPYMMPGFTFNLNNHYREDFNQEYLVVEVTHEGNQSHMLSAGIATETDRAQNQPIYRNNFKVIPNETQYRPLRNTKKPKISGTIHAKIDSELDTEYAQIDKQGRYRVKLPFDINNEHMDGQGSAPVRMMQSYAGKNRGMQFPLTKGTEVLLTFIEGNPDRPVIAGAVSNPETQGPVNANNLSESVIQTGGNNKIRMEDKSGSERMVFESPASNSWIRVGSKNDPPILNGSSGFYLEEGVSWQDEGAKYVDNTLNNTTAYVSIFANAADIKCNGVVRDWDASNANIGDWVFVYRATNSHNVEETATRTFTVYANANVTTDGEGDDFSNDRDGIRIRTAGNLWLESQSRYAEYVTGTPATQGLPRKLVTSSSTVPNQLGDMRDNFGAGYSPTGMLNYKTLADQESFQRDVLANAHVKLSSFDTVTTQEGNIYDFGGYWNYNLGNSYTEDHLDQSALLNATYKYDLLNGGGPHFNGWRAINDSASHKRIARFEGISPHSDSNNWSNIWVQKTFGDSYEYTEGSSISVSVGGSQDVEIGGVHVEEAYRGDGTKKSWSIRGEGGGKPSREKKWTSAGVKIYESKTWATAQSRIENEWKYAYSSGDLASYSGSTDTGNTHTSFNFNYSNNATSDIDAGFRTESSVYLLGKNSNSVFIGAALDVNVCLAGKLEIEVAPLGSVKIDLSGVTSTVPGFKTKTDIAKLESTLTAKIETNTSSINNVVSKINNHAFNQLSAGADLKSVLTVSITA